MSTGAAWARKRLFLISCSCRQRPGERVQQPSLMVGPAGRAGPAGSAHSRMGAAGTRFSRLRACVGVCRRRTAGGSAPARCVGCRLPSRRCGGGGPVDSVLPSPPACRRGRPAVAAGAGAGDRRGGAAGGAAAIGAGRCRTGWRWHGGVGDALAARRLAQARAGRCGRRWRRTLARRVAAAPPGLHGATRRSACLAGCGCRGAWISGGVVGRLVARACDAALALAAGAAARIGRLATVARCFGCRAAWAQHGVRADVGWPRLRRARAALAQLPGQSGGEHHVARRARADQPARRRQRRASCAGQARGRQRRWRPVASAIGQRGLRRAPRGRAMPRRCARQRLRPPRAARPHPAPAPGSLAGSRSYSAFSSASSGAASSGSVGPRGGSWAVHSVSSSRSLFMA